MQNWEALPEDPGLAPYCVLDKQFSASLAALKAKGATPTQMMRWGEIEAEKYEAKDPLFPLGAQAKIIEMIEALEALGGYPPEGYPGFPEYAYRSCLKVKPIGGKHP